MIHLGTLYRVNGSPRCWFQPMLISEELMHDTAALQAYLAGTRSQDEPECELSLVRAWVEPGIGGAATVDLVFERGSWFKPSDGRRVRMTSEEPLWP